MLRTFSALWWFPSVCGLLKLLRANYGHGRKFKGKKLGRQLCKPKRKASKSTTFLLHWYDPVVLRRLKSLKLDSYQSASYA